ncbi:MULTISPECIES: Gfo/Idh/MocA family protein [Weeksella]|uniref:Gfo/Idh/MocA family protein n=1 Tax=Weeksella TaxID=1013 RepID=UPI0008A4F3CF|nr:MULTISPECIES: Gfo/Idh/MocA family oxidoreductase [Weeksella]MDK7374182.1 Gfo/Idh/MocA family oxidoreductase [Weeksella virosa]OFM82858.1 oxidoreductase [Weeksella sp. HMSC059D05]
MLKVGVIGAGHLGKIHLKLLNQSSHYQLVGFYDSCVENGKSVSEEFGYRYFGSMDDLMDAVDVVDIVTPTLSHYEVAKKALEKNKHIFIEKPVTHTLEEADELLKMVKEKGLKAQVGHVERFNPAYIAAFPYINEPLFIETHRLAEFNPRGTDVPVVLDLMIHDLDIILSIVKSEIKSIHSSGVSVISNTPDIANARIEFVNGCVVNISTSRMSLKNMRKMRVFQRNAYISIDFLNKKTEIIKMHKAPENPSEYAMIWENDKGDRREISFEHPKIEANNAILDELESFANSIENGAPIKVSLQDGRNALKVALEIIDYFEKSQESIKNQTIIKE